MKIYIRPLSALLVSAVLCIPWGSPGAPAEKRAAVKKLSPAAEALREDAVRLAVEGSYDEALAKIEQALKSTDRAPQVVANYAAILAEAGRPSEAIREYESLPVSFEKPPSLTLLAAKCYRMDRQFERAKALYSYLLQENPKDEEAARGLVLTLFDMGNTDDALNILGTITEAPATAEAEPAETASARTSADALHRQAMDLSKHRSTDLALGLLEQAVGMPDATPEIRGDYVQLLAKAGNLDSAMAEYNKLPPDYPEASKVLNALARACREAGREKDAVVYAWQLFRGDPKDTRSAVALLGDLAALHEYEQMSDVADQALAQNPDAVDLLLAKAESQSSLGAKQDALATYEQILKRDKDNLKASRNAVSLLLALAGDEEPASALPRLERAVALSGHSEETLIPYAEALAQAGQCKKAIATYDRLDASARVPSSLIKSVAYCCLEQKSYEQAVVLFDKVLAEHPEDAGADVGVSRALMALHKMDEAARRLREAMIRHPENAELNLLQAQLEMERKNADAAITAYDRVLTTDPQRSNARHGKGEALVAKARDADCKRAVALLREAVELTGGDIDARLALVLRLAQCRQYEDAVAQFEALPKETKVPLGTRRVMAQVYSEQDDPETALSLCRQVLKQAPKDKDALLGAAQALEETGDLNGAAGMLQRTVTLYPDDLDAWLLKARVHAAKLEFTRALAAYDAVLAKHPDYEQAARGKAAVLLKVAAFSDCAAALRFLSQAVALSDRDNETLRQYIEALTRCEEYGKAVQEYEALPAKADRPVSLLYAVGDAYSALDRPEDAEAVYAEAVQRDPRQPETWLRLVKSLTDEGRNEDALVSLQQAVSLHPDNADVLSAQAHLLARMERYADAVSVYETLLDVDPENAEAATSCADILLRLSAMSDPDVSLVLIDKAIRLAGTRPDLEAARALALAETGRNAEAIQAFEHMPKDAPRSLALRKAMADAYLGEGRNESAIALLNRIFKENPQDATAAKSLVSTLREEERLKEALLIVEAALTANPQDLELLLAKAGIQADLINYTDAMQTYDHAIALFPRDGHARKRKAGLLIEVARLSDCAAATNFLQQAQELMPDSSEVDVQQVLALARCDMNAEAIAEYESLPNNLDRSPELLATAAECYQAMEQPKQAAGLYAQALKQNGPVRAFYVGLLDVLLADKAYKAAREHASTALEAFPEDTVLLMAKARAESALGADDAAIETCRRILQIDASHSEAQELMEELRPEAPPPDAPTEDKPTPDDPTPDNPAPGKAENPGKPTADADHPATPARRELLKGVILSLDGIRADDEETLSTNIDDLARRLRRLQVNVVTVEGFASADGTPPANALYFTNSVLPTIDTTLLPRVTRRLQEERITVFVAMPILGYALADRTKTEQMLVLEKRPSGTRPATGIAERLSPFSDKARSTVIDIFESLADHVPFHGILLMDDGFMTDREDYHPLALRAYREAFDLESFDADELSEADAVQWIQMKTDAIDSLTTEIMEAVRARRPAVFARTLFAPALHHPESEAWLAQNYAEALSLYDRVFLLTSPEMEDIAFVSHWFGTLVNHVSQYPEGAGKTVFLLPAYDRQRSRWISDRLLAKRVQKLFDLGAEGVAYYPDDCKQNKPRLRTMASAFEVR